MRRWVPYALFLALVLVFLWKPIFTGRALLPGDYLAQMSPWNSVCKAPNPAPQWNPLQWDAIAQFYPWRVFYARSMASGHIPLWNPHQFSGTPFLANGQSACLYPFNLLFLILDPITAFTVFAALHLFLAQVFMYWLMRELGTKDLGGIVAAVVFAFSAFTVLWLELPTFISVAVWLPLALMLVQRAVARRSLFYGMLAGLALGLSVLAGHFQIAFYVGLATGLWWLWKLIEVQRAEGAIYTLLKVGVPLIGCAVIAGLIAAPQVLPTQELAANSHRVRQVTEDGYQTFVDNAVPAYRLVTAFAPWFYGDPSQNSYYLLGRVGESRHFGSAADYMEYGLYAGVLPLMLALISLGSIRKKHVGFFVFLTALSLLCAIGTPINRLFYFGVPGFSALGGPNRILLLHFFGLAALAGFGADWTVNRWTDEMTIRERPCRIVVPAVFGAFLAVWVAAAVVWTWADEFRQSAYEQIQSPGPWASIGIPLAFAATWIIVMHGVAAARRYVSVEFGRRLAVPTVICVIIADLFAFGINYNPTCERPKVYPKTQLTTELQRLTKNGERIAPINPSWSLVETPKEAILPPNAAMVYGLYDVQGYDSLYTKAYKDLMGRIEGVDPSPPENGNMLVVRRVSDPAKLTRLAQVVIARDQSGKARIAELPHSTPPEPYSSPNRMIAGFMAGPTYPGWVMVDRAGKRYERYRDLLLAAPPGEQTAQYVFEPFTFRLGLFLMLVGAGALSCVGVYRAARYRMVAKG